MSAVPTVTLQGSAATGVVVGPEHRQALAGLPQTVRLGRVRPKARPPALALAHYLDPAKVELPPSVDYAAKAVAAVSRMYCNDRFGCCVISDRFHAEGVWTANDTGQALLGADDEVLSAYHGICGPGDNGCVISQVLDYARDHGIVVGGKPRKIDGYVSCNWRNADLVKAAVLLFGNLTVGVNLPEAWTRAAVWGVTNTQVVGGHDVVCVGYTAQGVQVSSWGRVYTITWAAFTSTRWLEEAYVVLAPDWYGDDSLAPSGVNVQALRGDLGKIAGGNVPPIDPGPAPPPVPPPAPGRAFGLRFPHRVAKGQWFGPTRAPVDIEPGDYDVVRKS